MAPCVGCLVKLSVFWASTEAKLGFKSPKVKAFLLGLPIRAPFYMKTI